ncbi:MAG: hypothetical protein QOI15_2492 [Pseudonocardiales bacterium]|jgi:hypothetical protein|nr:hypothetical protein [Pseudonocardiales bacterium]MDT4942879.1 hypothetical protein [Pseudonocardiales bacterium]
MANGRGPDLHQRYYSYLLEQVRADHYPSSLMLDLLEHGAHDQTERAELLDMLLEKVQQDRYPSPPMLRRIARIAG